MFLNLLDGTSSVADGNSSGSMIMMIVWIAVFGVIMYFMMIRPQKKKQKAEEQMRNNLQVGDEIITIGGFYGRVVSIKDDTITIESPVDHSKQTIAKWALQQNLTVHDEAVAKKDSKKESKKESK